MIRLRAQLNTNRTNVTALGPKAEFFLTIEDYLVYNDVAFYGTAEEKVMLSFMMMQKKGNDKTSLQVEEFAHFWH